MGIKVENVFYTYQKKASNSTEALNDVSLTIEDNDFVAIVGETGSGKSTLVQTINALLVPDKGEVKVDDFVINHKNRKSKKLRNLRKQVGLVFQFPEYQLFEETVEKDVAFGVKNFGATNDESLAAAHKALRQVGLDESYYKRPPFELSGGERRKVAIAGILALSPDIIIFDEPTVGFDPASAKDLMRLIVSMHHLGKTIIVITHDMDLINEYAKKVFMMENGKVVFEGTPSELFVLAQNNDCLDIPKVIKLAIALKEKGVDINLNQVHNIDDLMKSISDWRKQNG